MSDRLTLMDGPCAGQSIPVAAVARHVGGTFIFMAGDGSRHEYQHRGGTMSYVGLSAGPWICNSHNGLGHSCYQIVQPDEREHEGDHSCCCGNTWSKEG